VCVGRTVPQYISTVRGYLWGVWGRCHERRFDCGEFRCGWRVSDFLRRDAQARILVLILGCPPTAPTAGRVMPLTHAPNGLRVPGITALFSREPFSEKKGPSPNITCIRRRIACCQSRAEMNSKRSELWQLGETGRRSTAITSDFTRSFCHGDARGLVSVKS
jgi:hypothetical protein